MLKKGITAPVTREKFCGRHPNLTLRAPAALSKARAQASDPTVIDRYFDLLEEVLVKNDLVIPIWMNLVCLFLRSLLREGCP